MRKTYEALEHAEKEYQAKRHGTSHEVPRPGLARPSRRASTHLAIGWYEDLKTSLLTRHPNGSIKSILFTATAIGEGCSTTAINFAASLARDSHFQVLIVDANLSIPSFREIFDIDHTLNLSDLLAGNDQKTRKIKRVGPGNLYVLPCSGNHSEPIALLESKRFGQLLKIVREKFDYLIMDGPPVLRFSESRVLATKVDGVVLVIESGKTRHQVALRAKKQIEEAGGQLLGVFLNRKKYYIPDFIYRRL